MIFVCDVMLGKLARYLRMLGLDARYVRQGDDIASFQIQSEGSLFLTKKKGGASNWRTVVINADDPKSQLLEIRKYIKKHLNRSTQMSRCLDCNALLADIRKEDIEQLVPEYVFHHHEHFKTCPSCGKVYWEGSHAVEMRAWIDKIIQVK